MSRGLLWLGLLLSAGAQAYPHFQLSSGTATCQGCHQAPAGGGQLNGYGRDQSEDLSTWGGRGGLAHGLFQLPSWISVGGDLRLAGLLKDTGSTEGVQRAGFPMQADLSVRAGTDWLNATVVVGLRGVARAEELQPDSQLPPPPLPLLSREHYLSSTLPGTPLTLRAGRFFAPYGLRLADHTAYVRRFLDQHLEQEPYGLSASLVQEDWEVHGTAFVRDPHPLQAHDPGEPGAAAMGEVRVGSGSLGVSARAGFGSASRRLIGGAFAKWWLEEAALLWMGELDVAHQKFGGTLPSRLQLVAYGGPVWMPVTGLSVGAAYEAFAEDLSVRGTTRQAVGGWISWLPWSHLEVQLSSRLQWMGGGSQAWNLLGQLHYYL